MNLILLGLVLCCLSGCMTVRVTHCGPGDVTVTVDKAVSTLPVRADGNTVPVSAVP